MPCPAHLEPFNSTTARLAAVQSGVTRRLIAQETRLRLRRGKPYNAVASALKRQLALTRKQITDTHADIMAESDGKVKAMMRRELRGYLEHECKLLGIGEPARVRPVNQPASIRHVRSEPIQIDGGPVQSTPISSVPGPEPNG